MLVTVANQVGGASAALSADGSSSGSCDQLHMPELSDGNRHSPNTAEKNGAAPMMDGLWQVTPEKQPLYTGSLLLQSPYNDAFTTRLFTPVATSSPLPYFAGMPPPAVYCCGCGQRQAESVNSHPVTESYTMPVPPDAVLVRPRMPLVAGKHRAGCHKTTSPRPGTDTSVLLLSSAMHDAGCDRVDGNSHETRSSAATVYDGGFCVPPAHSSSLSHSHSKEESASFCCCPHCGVGFAAAAVPRNIVYHPTGPSYVIHSFIPTLQPCYSVTVDSVVARPPPPPVAAVAAATYTAGVRLPDGVPQQTSTRPPLPAHPPPASLNFVSAAPSLTGVRVRTARPPPSCANCGCIGHTQLDCKEPTIDTVLNIRE